MNVIPSEYGFGQVIAPTSPAERSDVSQESREAARRADWIALSQLKAQLNCSSEDIEDLIARWGFYSPNYPQAPPRQAKAGEVLLEFVRAEDRARITCELRFHGESYGREAQFLERGDLFYSRGAFVTRALAVQWATEERQYLEEQGAP